MIMWILTAVMFFLIVMKMFAAVPMPTIETKQPIKATPPSGGRAVDGPRTLGEAMRRARAIESLSIKLCKANCM